MCRRTTTDPLLSIFSADDCTLLRNMRTGVDVLDAWVAFSENGPFEPSGALGELIEGGLRSFPTKTAERTDVEMARSHRVEASVGLNLLAPFFAVVGVGALTKLRTHLAGKRNAHVVVSIGGVTEESVSLAAVAQELGSSQIAVNQRRLLTEGRRVAFAALAIRARSVEIGAFSEHGRKLSFGTGLVVGADLDLQGSCEQTSRYQLTFTGAQPVTFGVRLYELVLDGEGRTLRLARALGYPVFDAGVDAIEEVPPLLLDGSDGSLVADL